MTIAEAAQSLQQDLTRIYSSREAEIMSGMVMEKITNLPKIQRFLQEKTVLSPAQQAQYTQFKSELIQGKPVQYVLQEAWFMGLSFEVAEGVLIPRPETEELVDWIYRSSMEHFPYTVVDVGTGSGVIAIGLKKSFPDAQVYGVDMSPAALAIAQRNAQKLGFPVIFKQMDILDTHGWHELPKCDIIVSNPPYICLSEKKDMSPHVLNFEPEMALFVPDEDPLLFYRNIAKMALVRLNNNGWIYFEINEAYGDDVVSLLHKMGFHDVELKKDMEGKDRMVRAQSTHH